MARKSRARASRLLAPLGRGLIAGLLGTAAMTVSSTAEAKFTGRGASTVPAAAASKVIGVVPRDEAGETAVQHVDPLGIPPTDDLADRMISPWCCRVQHQGSSTRI
jgi:hypothetical protein